MFGEEVGRPGSSGGIWRWCRCRNRLPARARWSCYFGRRPPRDGSTPPSISTMPARCSCSEHGRSFDYDHRESRGRRNHCAPHSAGCIAQVDRWLRGAGPTPDVLLRRDHPAGADSWSRGRVTLVGDAGYCPGPAVGGSTSLAVFGAYVLAGELARAGGDHVRAFAAYERDAAAGARQPRLCARGRQEPRSRLPCRGLGNDPGRRLVSLLPASLTRTVAKFNTKGVRMYDSMRVPDYSRRWQHSRA